MRTTDIDRLRALDRGHVWHTWTPVGADRTELVLSHGRGHLVYDVAGREYIDASALNSTLGYAHPGVVAAIARQASRLHHVDISGATHEPMVALAERLASYLPPTLSRTLFVNSGSEGFEAALMMAAGYWAHRGEPRGRVVTFALGYQGATLASRTLSALPRNRTTVTTSTDVTLVDLPTRPALVRRPESLPLLLAAFERALTGAEPPAAVVVEPFLNVGGGIVLPAGFLRGLRDLCQRYDTLLVLDENFTAYGRTGQMFGFQWDDAEPDILVSSKGLTGGYAPLAAVTARTWIYESFSADPVIGGLRYGHTTSGHPVGCAAALATLDIVERAGLVERSRRLGRRLLDRLTPLAGHGDIVDVRGQGLTVVLEFASTESAADLIVTARGNGLLLKKQGPAGQSVLIVPPLTVEDGTVEAIADIVDRSAAEVPVTARRGRG